MRQFHLRISDSFADKLEELKELTDASSLSAVLRDAICVYTWVLKNVGEGHEIVAIDNKREGTREKVFTPGVEAVRMRSIVKSPL